MCSEAKQDQNDVKYLEKVQCKLYTSTHKEKKLIVVETINTLFFSP